MGGVIHKKGICFADAFFVEGTVKMDILDGRDRCRRTTQPAFWPAARVRRTSVLPQAKPRRRGGSAAPSIEIPKGGAALRAAEPTKKDICKADVLFCGANDVTRTHDLLITNQLLYRLSYISLSL